MSKLRFRISDSRTVDLSVPEIEKKVLPFQLLSWFQIGVIIVFGTLILRTSVLDVVKYSEIFELVAAMLLLVGGTQVLKSLIGGAVHLPESKFDLPSLLLAIGLISTLLSKQLLELPGGQGMLPSESAWHYTILGFLILLILGYLFDVVLRRRFYAESVFFVLVFLFEIMILAKYILSGEVYVAASLVLVVLLPMFASLIFELKNNILKFILGVNTILVSVVALLNIDMEISFVVLLGLIVLFVANLLMRQVSFEEIFQLVRIQKRKLNIKYSNKGAYFAFLILDMVLLSLVIGLNLIFGDRNLNLIRNGFESNLDAIKEINSIESFAIGGGFDVSYQSFFANMLSSYGVIGVFLLGVFFGFGIYLAYTMIRKLSLKTKQKQGYFLMQGVFGALVLATLVAFVFNFSIQLSLMLFLVFGFLANQNFVINSGKVMEYGYVVFGQNLKINWQRYIALGIQIGLVLATIVLTIYSTLNIEGIFLS